jgi:uncharacterized damage-inducible protein DinB
MTSKSHIQTLFGYHWHTTQRLMDCAAKLEEADYIDNPGYGHGSIHDLLFHLLRTDKSWRLGLETGRQLAPIRKEDFPGLRSLRDGFQQEQGEWQVLLDRLDANEIDSDISLTDRLGESASMPRWEILHHLVLHGMQHHAELAQLLTAKGQSPGNLDFIFYSDRE